MSSVEKSLVLQLHADRMVVIARRQLVLYRWSERHLRRSVELAMVERSPYAVAEQIRSLLNDFHSCQD